MAAQEVKIRVNPKIGIGLGSIAGGLASVAQYLGALALMLQGDLTAEALGTMATATFTLITVLLGRYKQASDAINAISHERQAHPVATTLESTPESNVLYLDGKEIAAAVVKAINTQALVNAMSAGAKEAPARV